MSHGDDVLRTFMTVFNLYFLPQGQIYRLFFLNMDSCSTRKVCLLWHCPIIFGALDDVLRTFMIPIRIEKVRFMGCLTCFRIRTTAFLFFDWIEFTPYAYRQYFSHVTAAFVRHSHTMFGTWMYHHRTMCQIHSWPLYDLNLNMKMIFLPRICVLARLSLL